MKTELISRGKEYVVLEREGEIKKKKKDTKVFLSLKEKLNSLLPVDLEN